MSLLSSFPFSSIRDGGNRYLDLEAAAARMLASCIAMLPPQEKNLTQAHVRGLLRDLHDLAPPNTTMLFRASHHECKGIYIRTV
jgi:hypothetical protein